MRALALAAAGAPAYGHVAMNYPQNWVDTKGVMRKPGFMTVGCGNPGPNVKNPTVPGAKGGMGCVTHWYTNYTFIPGDMTIPLGSPLLTFPLDISTRPGKNPWRAPGTAPIRSPCGVDGGNPDGCPPGNPDVNACIGGGYGYGEDSLVALAGDTPAAEWKAGGTAEVSFVEFANHGGGYSYRLCAKPAENKDLTEECFQKTPLRFSGDTQWLQFAANATRVAIPALRTTNGTHPAGSQWTRNPIPCCSLGAQYCATPQFQPPAPEVWGFFGRPGIKAPDGTVGHIIPELSVVDLVEVPATLPAGDYVLSYRYDAEETSQVWNSCANVRVAA